MALFQEFCDHSSHGARVLALLEEALVRPAGPAGHLLVVDFESRLVGAETLLQDLTQKGAMSPEHVN